MPIPSGIPYDFREIANKMAMLLGILIVVYALLWILAELKLIPVVLFMVLRDDTINQTMLVPMDLRNLIPEDHPCYFIKNVVDQIDCSQANRVFADKPGEFAYPRELLLRLILMSVFDGGLSSREIERKTRTDIAYMYLAGMQHPSYRTIARFKVDYPDLIDESFKTTIKIAKEEDLVKIHHVSLDGTKIKAKTSMNKLTNEQQLKIMKQHLKESIELDEEEDMELGEESEMVFQKH